MHTLHPPTRWTLRHWQPWPWILSALVLATAGLAMRFTDQVQWSPFDFVAAATLVLGACVLLELAARRGRQRLYVLGVALGVGTALVLTWVTLAVGVLGSEREPANAMFLGVVAFGGVAAVAAWGREGALAWAMAMTAALQAASSIAAWYAGFDTDAWRALAFALPWLASAACFARAARRSNAA